MNLDALSILVWEAKNLLHESQGQASDKLSEALEQIRILKAQHLKENA